MQYETCQQQLLLKVLACADPLAEAQAVFLKAWTLQASRQSAVGDHEQPLLVSSSWI
jgi:hypothetical protein